MSVHGQKLLGKLEAKGSNACWLLERDGKLSFLEINEIDSIRTAAPRFREFSLAELRDQLRRTLPKQFRIDGTGHFLICSEKNSHHLGEICEDTYRTFYRYFTVRGFKIAPPEFPLVVIVFPDHASFVSYCRKDGIEPPSGLLGYYMRLTNRVALFDRGQDLNADLNPAASHDRLTFAEHGPAVRFDGMVEGNLHDTIVHETTHQCAFNMGLHSRIGPTPKWVIEGLATMFEAPGIRDSQKSASPKSRINRSRYVWFGNYCTHVASRIHWSTSWRPTIFTRRPRLTPTPKAGADLFLAETRHASYGRYLKLIVQRNPLKAYSAAERVADFRRAFGDVNALETDYLRFFEKLK